MSWPQRLELTTTLAGTPMNHADPTRKHYVDYRYDSETEALHMETCLDIKAGQEVFCSYSKVFFPCPWYDKLMTEAGLTPLSQLGPIIDGNAKNI